MIQKTRVFETIKILEIMYGMLRTAKFVNGEGIVMSKYLVKLMPLGKFFFGGDMTFKIGNKETAFSSYIIHSFTTPQQTSILGMMRFLILSNNDEAFNIKENRIKAFALF